MSIPGEHTNWSARNTVHAPASEAPRTARAVLGFVPVTVAARNTLIEVISKNSTNVAQDGPEVAVRPIGRQPVFAELYLFQM